MELENRNTECRKESNIFKTFVIEFLQEFR